MVRTVLIADSNVRLAGLLSELLGDEPEFSLLDVCRTADRVLERASTWRPDVVLVSEVLQGDSGGEVCRALRLASPGSVLLLWSHDPHVPPPGAEEADAVIERGMTFRDLLQALRSAQRAPRAPALVAAHADTDLLRRDVLLAPISPTPARVHLDAADDDGRMLLTCDSCQVRLPVPTDDMPAAVDQARDFFSTHDRCETTIDVRDRSSRLTSAG